MKFFPRLLLHINQDHSMSETRSDYESAALTVELQGHKELRAQSVSRRHLEAANRH